ncbi:MAG: hypothetical protein AB9907_07015 [Flexilinea sp.]
MLAKKLADSIITRYEDPDTYPGKLWEVCQACEALCIQNSYEDYVRYPQKINAREAVASCL